MRASIISQPDGLISLQMDPEAARAVFASIVFAARFHEDIGPLSMVAEMGLNLGCESHECGRALCQ